MPINFHRADALHEKAAPAAVRRPMVGGQSPSIPSIVGQGLTFEGSITGEGDLHVDGELLGDVVVGRLSIGETGCVKGAIVASSVEVRGAVIGSITAKLIRLVATAHVDGDITLEQLEVEKGASLEGACMKLRATPPVEGPKAPEPESESEETAVD